MNDIETGLNNTITITAKELRTELKNTKEGLESSISQTASQIRSEVANADAGLSSRITQNSNSITSEITRAEEAEGSLSSRIEQTIKSIRLSVENGDTLAGITISVTNEDGSTSKKTGTIEMKGLVGFTNLQNDGETIINGGNITTGTLDASKVTVKNLNASNITTGTLNANLIKAKTLKVDRLESGSYGGKNYDAAWSHPGHIITGIAITKNSSGVVTGIKYKYASLHYIGAPMAVGGTSDATEEL